MEIVRYEEEYKEQIIDHILNIQNNEYFLDLTIEEESDLLDIENEYFISGGYFWVAIENNKVIGTIALQKKTTDGAVLKKFFVNREYRNRKIGLMLYQLLIDYCKTINIHTLVLDTPSVTHTAHNFYRKAGFKEIPIEDLSFKFDYPDRDSIMFIKKF